MKKVGAKEHNMRYNIYFFFPPCSIRAILSITFNLSFLVINESLTTGFPRTVVSLIFGVTKA